MSRVSEINDFLKYVYNYCKKNNAVVTEGIIYDALANYGFNPNELNIQTDSLFPMWIDRFKDKPNIECYHSDRQPHFLQFANGRTLESKHIKLYFSLSPNAYYEGVNMIFDFIEKNNMKTGSKVADTIRSDEIVLRMESTDDAEKLIQFINNNPYLKENSRPTNPFLNRAGVVGVGYDDLLSYNQTISMFIADYLNKTNNPSYEDFVNYLNNRYINLFQNQSELNEFTQSELFKRNLGRIATGFGYINNPELYTINNYRIVFEAILNNIYDEDYKKLYGCMDQSKDMFSKMTNVNKFKLLDDYIKYAYQKYNNNINLVYEALYRYSNSEVNAITRDNGFRDKFIYNINPKIIMEVTNNDIFGFVSNVISSVELEKMNEQTQMLKDIDFDMFIKGLRATYESHGRGQVIAAVEHLLKGNFNVMSNGDYGYRNYFKNKYSVEDLSQIAVNSLNKIINDRTIRTDLPIGNVICEILEQDYGFGTQGRGR